MIVHVELPVTIVSEPNRREHWAVRHRRHQLHRRWAYLIPKVQLEPPLKIHLERIGGRRMDDDNLVAGFKSLRDGIADRLGIDDGDRRVTWSYAQVPGGKQGSVMVHIHDKKA